MYGTEIVVRPVAAVSRVLREGYIVCRNTVVLELSIYTILSFSAVVNRELVTK
jgi:hypothetical protein